MDTLSGRLVSSHRVRRAFFLCGTHEKKKSGTPPPLEVKTDDVAAVLKVFKKLLKTHPDLYGFYFATVVVAEIEVDGEILSFTSDVQTDETRVHYVGAEIHTLAEFRRTSSDPRKNQIIREAESVGDLYIVQHPNISTILTLQTAPPNYKLS